MPERVKRRLGEILLEDGVLSKSSLDEALEHQKKEGGLIGQILIKLGYLTEEELTAAIGKQLHIPYLPLAGYSVNRDAALRFEIDYCKKNLVFIFDQDARNIYVVMGDPLNESALEEITSKSSLRPQVFISTPTEILSMLDLLASSVNTKRETKKAG